MIKDLSIANDELGNSKDNKYELSQALSIIKDFQLVYDTNILCKACDKNAQIRDAVSVISGQNTPIICDTVFWEFLRNCNLDTFRLRRKFLEASGHTHIEHEDHAVGEMYTKLWMTYLAAFKNDPKRLSKIPVPDLRIAAFCVEKRYDRILTEDNTGDFPPELFDTMSFKIGNNFTIHLKTFKRETARMLWIDAQKNDITIDFSQWR